MTYYAKQPSSRILRHQNLSYAGSASVPSTPFSSETFQIRVFSQLAGFFTVGDVSATAGTTITATTASGIPIAASTAAGEYWTVSPGQQFAFISTSTSSGNVGVTEMT
jgi:hypothetical protein